MEENKIVSLSKKSMIRYLESMLEIDGTLVGESWNSSNFLLDLPGKWEYSRLALNAETPIGFLIASVKSNDILHVHRLVIAQNYRRQGIGLCLLKNVSKLSHSKGLRFVTLKTAVDNFQAHKFYRKVGFMLVNQEDPRNLLFSIPVDNLLTRRA